MIFMIPLLVIPEKFGHMRVNGPLYSLFRKSNNRHKVDWDASSKA
jgi:hypothetical protein